MTKVADAPVPSWVEQATSEQSWVPRCPLCDERSKACRLQIDHYGIAVGLSVCACGFVYLNPRVSQDAYLQLFVSGGYRELQSRHVGYNVYEGLEEDQTRYGRALAAFIGRSLVEEGEGHRSFGDILDLGGSIGAVSRQFLSDRVVVVDPAFQEVPPDGIQGVLKANAETSANFDLVLICRTIDHIPDPVSFLETAVKHLVDDGYLWIDAIDYELVREVSFDLPSNFTQATLMALVESCDLEVIAVRRDGRHVGVVCQRG